VLWHESRSYMINHLRELRNRREEMQWVFTGGRDDIQLEVALDGSGLSLHRLPYLKTNCLGTFNVSNNSLASASMVMTRADGSRETLQTGTGAVLEMVG
jgi:hypothetical protein